jgi:hydroxymethylglutaryl-CoA lyase
MRNICVSLDHGIRVVDASVAGLGGCPFAKGATGNVATEDVVAALHPLGVDTGIDLYRLSCARDFIRYVLSETEE